MEVEEITRESRRVAARGVVPIARRDTEARFSISLVSHRVKQFA
jgi:hypothetical protein